MDFVFRGGAGIIQFWIARLGGVSPLSAAPFSTLRCHFHSSPLGIGSRVTVQIEILTLYLTILFFNNWNLTGSNSDSGPGKSRGVLSPGACWLASLGVVSTGGGEEAVRRPNKSFQSKTTMSGSPTLTHKPLGQGQGPKGPALAPKQSQAQKWVEAESRALLSTGGGEEAESLNSSQRR